MFTGKKFGAAIKEAIDLKMEKRGIDKKTIATDFGIKPPSLHGWIKTGRVGKDHLFKLFEYFKDVVGAEHWGFASDSEIPKDISLGQELSKALIDQKLVPIVGTKNILNDEKFESNEHVFTRLKFKGQSFALINKDKGMPPDFAVGSLLIVDTGLAPDPGDFVIAIADGRVVLRQYSRPQPGVIGLKALSGNHESYDSTTTPFHIIGVVVEHRRYLKDED